MDTHERVASEKRPVGSDKAEPSPDGLMEGLLTSDDWVTLTLALALVEETDDLKHPATERIERLEDHPHPQVSATARATLAQRSDRRGSRKNDGAAAGIPLVDKMVHLQTIDLFAGLPIQDLAAVAAAVEVSSAETGATIFREGEHGEVLYLPLTGELSAVTQCNEDQLVELDRVDGGGPVGEMALFGDHLRPSTIQATAPTQLLSLHKQQFITIVREHPLVGLHACRVLSRRLRRLHAKISDLHC
jgi:hypothetical protein